MAETINSTPNAQAYDEVLGEMRGRFAPNIANIRLFKDNPYLKDLTDEDKIEANADFSSTMMINLFGFVSTKKMK